MANDIYDIIIVVLVNFVIVVPIEVTMNYKNSSGVSFPFRIGRKFPFTTRLFAKESIICTSKNNGLLPMLQEYNKKIPNATEKKRTPDKDLIAVNELLS